MRRISTGVVGRPILGELTALDNALQSIDTNANITIQPNGNGVVVSTSTIQLNNESAVKLGDNDNSNFVSIKAPATVGSDFILTLPDTGGTDGYVLKTDGSGNLSWIETVVNLADQTVDSSTYYPVLSNTAGSPSGSLSTLNTSTGKLEFVPSTGTVSCSAVSSGSGTFTGTVQAATLTETSSIALKEDVQVLNDAMDKILSMTGVSFKRKTTGEYEAGLIAEEVEAIAPELVNTEGDYKSIQYSRLTAYLIEAIKQLNTRLDKVDKWQT